MRALRLALDLLLWPPAALTAWLCAAAAVAGQWGRTSLKLDVLNHFAPIWLLGAAGALAVTLMFRGWRRWVIAPAAIVGVLAAGALVVPEFLRDTGPHAPANAPEQLKIIQFNVWHNNADPAQVFAWIKAERPDIVVVEESLGTFKAALAEHGDGWHVACRRCDVTVLSREKPLGVSAARRIAGRPPVPLTRALFRDRHGLFEVVGVHNAWPTDVDQPYQERRLAEYLETRPKARLIVVGDFNSAPWSFQRRRWDQAFGLVRRERALPTWPAQQYGALKWLGLPFLPIDHIYAGPGWATVSVRRGPRLSSDHYPVVITLAPVVPRT